jgi:hypothetical protein
MFHEKKLSTKNAQNRPLVPFDGTAGMDKKLAQGTF